MRCRDRPRWQPQPAPGRTSWKKKSSHTRVHSRSASSALSGAAALPLAPLLTTTGSPPAGDDGVSPAALARFLTRLCSASRTAPDALLGGVDAEGCGTATGVRLPLPLPGLATASPVLVLPAPAPEFGALAATAVPACAAALASVAGAGRGRLDAGVRLPALPADASTVTGCSVPPSASASWAPSTLGSARGLASAIVPQEQACRAPLSLTCCDDAGVWCRCKSRYDWHWYECSGVVHSVRE